MDEGLKKKQTSWCYYGDLANWGMEKDGISLGYLLSGLWEMEEGKWELKECIILLSLLKRGLSF